MPIPGIPQPPLLLVDPTLRLRQYDGRPDFALSWYQDQELLRLVDGPEAEPYTRQDLRDMFEYYQRRGEVYWIEVLEQGEFVPVGDVTFLQHDLPIVIGEPSYRGIGIGSKVVAALVRRGKALGYSYLEVREIYAYNLASQKLFENAGFQRHKKTKYGYSYRLE